MTMRTTVIVSSLALLAGTGLASWYFLKLGVATSRIDTSRGAIIMEMRQLGRLETSSFTIEKIIEAKKDGGGPWRNILFGDKLLLIANGDVVAGYDLAALSEKDVEKKSGALHMRLPAPKILSVRLNNEKTRVYDRDQGLLSRGDKDLESEARLAAEQSIRDAACAAGILRAAEESARKQLKVVLEALGYSDPVIQSPPGSC